MAEGKKYIAIVELDEDSALREQWPFFGGCDGCIANTCYKDCEINKFPITRQEAISRMAKAMCHSPYESCEGCIVQKKKQACKQALEGMKELAEAALNALLEVNNER